MVAQLAVLAKVNVNSLPEGKTSLEHPSTLA